MISTVNTAGKTIVRGLVAVGLLFNCAAAAPMPEVRIVPQLRIVEGTRQNPSYRYVPAVQVAEGQELFYTVYVRNTGTQPLQDYALVLPIPTNTRYVANTAAGAGAEVTFSIDGGRTFARPARLRADDAARAAAAGYTHIRWQWSYPLGPGSVVLARFRTVFK